MVNSPTFVGRARRSESRFHNDFAARRVGRGWCVSEARGSLCDQLGGWFCGLGLIPPRLAVRWAQRQTCC
jgi:hypothetical protein